MFQLPLVELEAERKYPLGQMELYGKNEKKRGGWELKKFYWFKQALANVI